MDLGDLADKLPTWLLLAAFGAPGFWAVFKQWDAGRKDGAKQHADLVKIAQEAAAGVIEDLQAHIDRLHTRISNLEAELNEARREHSETVASKDAEIALLRGQVRQWQALAQSYEQKLSQAGIEHELPRQPFWGLPAGDTPADLVEGRLP